MKTFKKVLRIVGLIILITFALTGIGIGNVLATRERYLDKEIRTEQTDKRENEENEMEDDLN